MVEEVVPKLKQNSAREFQDVGAGKGADWAGRGGQGGGDDKAEGSGTGCAEIEHES